MKTPLTYNEAYEQLAALVEELEDGNIQLEQLATKVTQANELIAICDGKLRAIQGEVDGAMGK